MKNYNLYLYFSLLSLQLVSPTPPQINLCCRENHAYKLNTKLPTRKKARCDFTPTRERTCQPHNTSSDLLWDDRIWSGEERLDKLAHQHFKFVPTDFDFECSERGETEVPAESLFYSTDLRVQKDGRLLIFDEKNDTIGTYKDTQYCVSFTDRASFLEVEDEDTELALELRTLYVVCYKIETDKSGDFKGIFYPVSIFISCFFLLLTIFVYIILRELRSNIFGKITLGFLGNVFICYFFLGINHTLTITYNEGELLNTPFCIFLGYIIQHTFIAFFFWTNAMAIDITWKFSRILSFSDDHSNKRIIYNIIYAQGFPAMITLVTMLMDFYGSCDSILPNMGQFTCFLGSEYDPTVPFAKLPEFVYYYSIVTVIMVVNVICFSITGFYLISHWVTVRTMQRSSSQDVWTHTLVVSKLFLIMGIPWIFDVISAAVEHDDPSFESNGARYALDILNLLQGFITFIVLCCKKSILRKLEKKFNFKAARQDSLNSRVTQDESINLRRISTVSGISTVSEVSNNTVLSDCEDFN